MTKREQLDAVYQRLKQNLHTLPLGTIGEPTVPGDGDAEAELMFIGEAPGFHESQQRKPFVGRSGQLFIKTLAAVGFPRPEVYITNIVKVRPPENRDPTPAEISAYRPYLDQEIEIIRPKLIITLGRLSMGKFLPEVKISQVHGRLHKIQWKDTQLFILPMYHPAAALRNPQMQLSFVNDFQKIPKILEWIKTKGQTYVKEGVDQSEFETSIKDALL
jgi:uracil-DNA glycosylase